MQIHELKTDPEVFELSWNGLKPFEIRYNDRDFMIGDLLILRETRYSHDDMIYGGKTLEYTGRQVIRQITCITTGYGIQDGWAILGVCVV